MGWESRGRRIYYYSKRREGRRVVSSYVPAGQAGLIVRLVDLRNAEAVQAQEAARLARERTEAADADLAALGKLAEAAAGAALIANGFHQHKRQWRRRRG